MVLATNLAMASGQLALKKHATIRKNLKRKMLAERALMAPLTVEQTQKSRKTVKMVHLKYLKHLVNKVDKQIMMMEKRKQKEASNLRSKNELLYNIFGPIINNPGKLIF